MVLRFCYPVDRDAKRPYRRSRCVRTGEDRQVSIRSRTTKTHRQPLSRLSAAVVASTVGFIPALKGGAFSLHFRNRTANRTATANRTVADKTESTAPQQHRPVPHCIAPPYTAQHRPAPHCTASTRPTLHSIDPPHTALPRTAPRLRATSSPTDCIARSLRSLRYSSLARWTRRRGRRARTRRCGTLHHLLSNLYPLLKNKDISKRRL